MRSANGAKLNICKCIVLIAVMLVFFTTCITSGIYARYTATGALSSVARVAKLKVTSTGATTPVFVDIKHEDVIVDYPVTVFNDSEVDLAYKIRVKTSQPLPAGVTLQILEIAGSEKTAAGQTEFVFEEGVWRAYQQSTTAYTLRLYFSASAVTSSAVDIRVDVGVFAEQATTGAV